MEVRSMLTGILSRRNTASHRWITRLKALPFSPPHLWISFPPFSKNKNRRIPFVVSSCIRASMFPTAALSTSGIRVEGLSFLSACCNKLPCIFSYKTKTGDNLFGASCKKLCLSLPTAALSASGLRVEGFSFLSARLTSSPVFVCAFIIRLCTSKSKTSAKILFVWKMFREAITSAPSVAKMQRFGSFVYMYNTQSGFLWWKFLSFAVIIIS